MLVNEKDLPHLPCPVMDMEGNPHYSISQAVAKAAILRSFEGNPIPINKLRDRYVTLWDNYWKQKYGEIPESPLGPYWAGPRTSITVANKIVTFLNEYEVVIPLQPYSYVLDSLVIEGTSCVVRKKSSSNKPRSYFTVIFQEEVSDHSKPDVQVLTKWYYVESLYAGVIPTGVLFVPLLRGKIKPIAIKNVKLAREWITKAFATNRNLFPISGSHCKSCKSRKCEEVLNVGQNEDRRIRWLREVHPRR